jgi:hypothetical protein
MITWNIRKVIGFYSFILLIALNGCAPFSMKTKIDTVPDGVPKGYVNFYCESNPCFAFDIDDYANNVKNVRVAFIPDTYFFRISAKGLEESIAQRTVKVEVREGELTPVVITFNKRSTNFAMGTSYYDISASVKSPQVLSEKFNRKEQVRIEDILEALENTKNHHVRCKYIELLGETKDSRAVAPLLDYLNNFGMGCEDVAAKSLGNFKEQRAIDALIAVLRQPLNLRLKEIETVKSLKKITGQDFGKDSYKWQEWWDQNRATYEQ